MSPSGTLTDRKCESIKCERVGARNQKDLNRIVISAKVTYD